MGKSTRTNTAYRRPADRERRQEKHRNTARFFKNLQNHGDSVIFFEKQANYYYRAHYRRLLEFNKAGQTSMTYITDFEIKRPQFNSGTTLSGMITYDGEHQEGHLMNLKLRIKFSQYFIEFYELMFSFKRQLFDLTEDEYEQLKLASFKCDEALRRGYKRLYPDSWLDIGLSSQRSLKEPKTRTAIIKTIELALRGKDIVIADD